MSRRGTGLPKYKGWVPSKRETTGASAVSWGAILADGWKRRMVVWQDVEQESEKGMKVTYLTPLRDFMNKVWWLCSVRRRSSKRAWIVKIWIEGQPGDGVNIWVRGTNGRPGTSHTWNPFIFQWRSCLRRMKWGTSWQLHEELWSKHWSGRRWAKKERRNVTHLQSPQAWWASLKSVTR